MNKNKTVWIIIGAIIVIVACVALAGKYLGSTTNPTADNGAYASPVSAEVTATTTSPSLAITLSAPASTTASISVETSSTLAAKTFRNSSYAFAYPGNWTIGSGAHTSINNFGASSWSGGLVPPGGAEISVATTTLYGSLSDMVHYEFLSMTNVTTSTVTVSGVSCTEGRGKLVANNGALSQNEVVYCPRGHAVWKIYFSYRAGDPKAANFVSVLSGILASFKFLP
jgi:hypothetical protein